MYNVYNYVKIMIRNRHFYESRLNETQKLILIGHPSVS